MKAKTQKILAAGAALALLGIMAASLLLRRDRVVERTDFLMSTVVDQKITGREAEKTGDRVVEMLQELEHTLSLYDEASEIAAVNAAAGRNAVTVSEGTYKLLKRSTALSAETGGTFNLAIAPVTLLWHDAMEAKHPPEPAAVSERLRHIDYQRIRFDDENRSVMLEEEGMALDLGGIAKGYAAALAGEIYREADIRTALISIGGNIYCWGAPKGQDAYRIGVRDPQGDAGDPLLIMSLTDKIIASSGAYERYFEYEWTIYHHIIDPDTGYPCETDLLSVTVITDDGALADCLSTSLFIQGRDAVLDILRRQQAGEDIGYSLIIVDETGNIYVSPALTSAVSLAEGKESAYRLAEIPPK